MNAISVIDAYLDSLCKLIRAWGASSSCANEVRENVKTQICSFLTHWSDIEFRNTLLVIGKEEGLHYKPGASINPFVVLTIRNSMVERLHSINHQETGLEKGIGASEIKRITQQAIRHFSNVRFDELAASVDIATNEDCYGDLPEKFPLAWAALCHIGNHEDNAIFYEPVVHSMDVDYSDHIPSSTVRHDTLGNSKRTVLDGYSTTIDSSLQEYLNGLRMGRLDCFYVDSFKMVTRNTGKLLYVLNHVLVSNREFVTANYYITNGYIERRPTLLPPVNSNTDPLCMERGRQLLTGDIGGKHKAALRVMFI